MRRITDTTTTPRGGWRYTEPTTGVPFEGMSYKATMSEIRKHRVAMGLPVTGNWLDEVHEAMVALNPLIPHQEIGVPERRIGADDVIQFVRVTRELLKDGELVSEEEQLRRATICSECPKRGVVSCKFCGWLARQITEMMGNRKIPKVEKIFKHSCMGCGCDLTAKTACPMPLLKKVDEMAETPPDYAPGCWMLEP